MDPLHVVVDYKRLIRRRVSLPSSQIHNMNFSTFKLIPGAGDRPMLQIRHNGEEKQFFFEDISSALISIIKQNREALEGRRMDYVIARVPDCFSDSQLQATNKAANTAGINSLKFINESAAAAIVYGLDKKASASVSGKINVLVYNLGGSSLDLSLMSIDQEGVFCMKAFTSDAHLGGEDFTSRLVNHFAAEFKSKHKRGLRCRGGAPLRLRAACDRAKLALSSHYETTIHIDSLYKGIDFYGTITRDTFEKINMGLFEECIASVNKFLMEAEIGKNQVDDVVLLGGSSRIPKMQQMLQEFFDGKELCTGRAHGTAFLEEKSRGGMVHRIREIRFLDFAQLSIGIETSGGLMTVLIPRNTTFPAKRERVFSTYSDNQRAVVIRVYQGVRPMAKDNKFLTSFELAGLNLAPSGTLWISVCIEVKADGMLIVSAEDQTAGLRNNVGIVNYKGRLSAKKVKSMIREAEEFKAEDEGVKKRVEAKNSLEYYAYYMRRTIKDEKVRSRLYMSEKKVMEKAIDEVIEWLDGNQQLGEVGVYEDKGNGLLALWRRLVEERCLQGTNADVNQMTEFMQALIELLEECGIQSKHVPEK